MVHNLPCPEDARSLKVLIYSYYIIKLKILVKRGQGSSVYEKMDMLQGWKCIAPYEELAGRMKFGVNCRPI